MKLVWKLLRKHISIAQFVGFCVADMLGMLIVLLGFQFYKDVLPVFTEGDSFLKTDYLIVSKHANAIGQTNSSADSFAPTEIAEIAQQPFIKTVGAFTSAAYHVEAAMSFNGANVLRSELFLESLPDHFIDVPLENWHYAAGEKTVPIILPRSYLTMYNFGFARSRSLPKINEGLVGMLDIDLYVRGKDLSDHYRGRVIGFSGRINTILVPESFLKWSNTQYAKGEENNPTRLAIEAKNPTDTQLTQYFEDNDYDLSDNNLDTEKTTQFLRMMVIAVMLIGGAISLLSFYTLILSIYLLVQKNNEKLENLLLIGYSPATVAQPYLILVALLNLLVFVLVAVVLLFCRNMYMDVLLTLFPNLPEGTIFHSLALGFALFLLLSLIDAIIISRKIKSLYNLHKQ